MSIHAFAPRGRIIDLANPAPGAVDFRLMADRLSRMSRFSGEIGALSVAQHSVLGAEALLAEGHDPLTARLFLLHDGHEYVLGDWTRPVQALMAGALGQAFDAARKAACRRWDEAIWQAAGIDRALVTQARLDIVDLMDRRMAALELRALYGPRAIANLSTAERKTPLISGAIDKPWPPEKSAERFLALLSKLSGRTFR